VLVVTVGQGGQTGFAVLRVWETVFSETGSGFRDVMSVERVAAVAVQKWSEVGYL
jgi:hypothetical protein